MKTKLLLPVLAAIFAIGMSFTTLKADNQANDYIRNNGTWEVIPQQDCNPGNFTCQVQIGVNGPIFNVYDEMDLGTKKTSGSPDANILN